ncbi:MAG: GspH/FimT family pseudopilin [Acidobacteriaceae bacterium]
MRDRTRADLQPASPERAACSGGRTARRRQHRGWRCGHPDSLGGRVSRAPDRPAHATALACANGFTLMELIVTIAVAAILAALALPDFSRFLIRGHILTQANTLVADLTLARSEAVRRQEPVTLCVSTDGATCNASAAWQSGWIEYANPNGATSPAAGTPPLRVRGVLTQDVVVASSVNPVPNPAPGPSSGTAYLTFKPDGRAVWGYKNVTTPSTFAAVFAVCDASPRPGDLNGIDVTVDISGLIASSTQTQPCPTP